MKENPQLTDKQVAKFLATAKEVLPRSWEYLSLERDKRGDKITLMFSDKGILKRECYIQGK